MATTSSRPAIANEIGSVRWMAAVPASTRMSRISSVAYATEDSASDEKTARRTVLESRSCRGWAGDEGRPTSQRLPGDRGAPTSQRFTRLVFNASASGRAPGEPGAGHLHLEDRRGDGEGARLVEPEALRVALPQVERDRAAVRPRPESSALLGEPH